MVAVSRREVPHVTYRDTLKHFTDDEKRRLDSDDYDQVLPLLINKAVSREISMDQLIEICHQEAELRLHEAQENGFGPVRFLRSRAGV